MNESGGVAGFRQFLGFPLGGTPRQNSFTHSKYQPYFGPALGVHFTTFAIDTIKKHSNALNRRVFVVNRAIAARFGRSQAECDAILSKEDWSDCGLEFKLAVAVLRSEYERATKLMHEVGEKNTFVTRLSYDTWPLFRDFRETAEFRDAYRQLFGLEFRVPDDGRPRIKIVSKKKIGGGTSTEGLLASEKTERLESLDSDSDTPESEQSTP